MKNYHEETIPAPGSVPLSHPPPLHHHQQHQSQPSHQRQPTLGNSIHPSHGPHYGNGPVATYNYMPENGYGNVSMKSNTHSRQPTGNNNFGNIGISATAVLPHIDPLKTHPSQRKDYQTMPVKSKPPQSNKDRKKEKESEGNESSSEQNSYPAGSMVGPYVIEKTLGQGSYGKVKLAYHQQTKERVALKFINKSNIKKETHLVRIRREIRLLRILSHPNIIKLLYASETDAEIILVMEHASGGELLDYIQSFGKLTESQARPLFRQIVSSVSYIHSQCLIHRDLKPQNLLLNENQTVIKLVDFGFANTFEPRGLLSTFCGSPFYASPEMVSGTKYTGPEVDIWSLGVIFYSMLTGNVPFNDENVKGLYSKILNGEYEVPMNISSQAKDLIRSMLTVQSKQRISLPSIMNHPWLCYGNSEYLGSPDSYIPERHSIHASAQLDHFIIQKLKDYNIDVHSAPSSILKDPSGKVASIYWLLYEKLRFDEEEPLSGNGNKRLSLQRAMISDDEYKKRMLNKELVHRLSLKKEKTMVTSNGFVIPERILSSDEIEPLFDSDNVALQSPTNYNYYHPQGFLRPPPVPSLNQHQYYNHLGGVTPQIQQSSPFSYPSQHQQHYYPYQADYQSHQQQHHHIDYQQYQPAIKEPKSSFPWSFFRKKKAKKCILLLNQNLPNPRRCS